MNNIKLRILRISNAVHISAVYLAIAFLIMMTGLIIVSVFMRYVLNTGLRWGEEVSKLFMVWFTFIGMAVGIRHRLHISINIISGNLHPSLERGLLLIKDIITLLSGKSFRG